MIAPYNRVIVTKRHPQENLFPGDVGTVVEEYSRFQGKIIGYELELFVSRWAYASGVFRARTRSVQATPANRLVGWKE